MPRLGNGSCFGENYKSRKSISVPKNVPTDTVYHSVIGSPLDWVPAQSYFLLISSDDTLSKIIITDAK